MEIRKLRAHEFEEAIRLADRTFREDGHVSMGHAFPKVFSSELQQSFGAFQGDRLISFMGLVPAKIRVGISILTVYSLGAVCTDEQFRSQGISTAILKEVYAYIKQAGASLLFVSGDRGMYMRNDCYYFGKKIEYTIQNTGKDELSYEGVIRQGEPADLFLIDFIRQKKTVDFESSLWEWNVLVEAGGYASIFNLKQKLFVALNGSSIDGYAVVGLPTKSNSVEKAIVSEWGGDAIAVNAILQNVLKLDNVTEIAMNILWDEEFAVDLSAYPNKVLYNGGTVHIANGHLLVNQLMPFLHTKNSALASSLSISECEQGFEIRFDDEILSVTKKELVQLLFDPQSGNNGKLSEFFPIPLPHLEGLFFV